MIKKRNIKLTAVCLAALFIFLLIIPAVNAFAVSGIHIYKVGANPIFGINKINDEYSGLSCDYLNAISKYTDDKYTYVDGTPDELFEMLKNGEIDMIPCVTETELSFYESSFGSSVSKLFKQVGTSLVSRFSAVYVYNKGEYSDTVLNDVTSIRRMTIGYLDEDKQSYFKNDRFIYSEIEGANFVPYKNETAMHEAFVAGDVDAVIKDCLRPWVNETIVYRFAVAPGYFVVRESDSELSKQLSSGLTSLFSDYPTFYGDVYERRVSNYGTMTFAYDATENEFIKNHTEITLGYNLESDFTKSYDSVKGTLGGVIGSITEKYTEKTGLKVNVKAYENLNECLDALNNKEVDMIFGGINSDDMSGRLGCYVTEPVITARAVLAGKENTAPDNIKKIAVKSGDEAISTLTHSYPDAFMTFAKSSDSIFSLAVNGDCDAVCLKSYEALYLKNSGYDIDIIRILPIYSEECFGLRPSDKGLCGITENALAEISVSNFINDVYEDLNSTNVKSTNYSVVIIHAVAISVLVFSIFVIIIVVVLKNKHRAKIDPLTGGLSRKSFIVKSIRTIKKSDSTNWTLVVFDIDKFKFVNDRLGYEEGNRMLERIYKTLGDQMENGETYARISDDNFVCCLFGASDNDITNRINSVFDEFERRNSLYVSYPVFFSAGVCRLEQCVDKYGSVNFNVAIDRCNIAKKTIKSMHSNSIAFYDGKIREKALREKDFENAMPTALENHEFMCYIQPKYGAKSRRIEGGEALIRWKSSEFGFVFPNEFIPLAEKNGFVVELDFFILEEVCKAMRHWIDKGIKPVVISVNMSRVHLTHDDFIWRLREIIDKYAIPYEYIELEITETVFSDNADLLLRVMKKLHDIGFQLSIDDFGSGYSSLNMLKDIPADVVKIDREFFNGTVNSDKGRAVITAVVDLAQKLDMQVISEGVETLEQVEFLDEINCELIQGYYFAKPMPLKDFEKLWFKEREEKVEKPQNSETSPQDK